MDQLTPEQKENLSKTNTERLRTRLAGAGFEEDVVFAMDRPALLEAAAKLIVRGPVKPAASASEKPISVWEKELALREQELALRKEERQAEQRRWDEIDRQRKLEREEDDRRRKAEKAEEAAQRKADLEEAERRREAERAEEAVRREVEEERWREEDRLRREEVKLRTEELQRQQRLDTARLKDENSLIGRTKKIAEIVKNVIPSQPSENAELPAFFDSVENLFKLYEIGDDLKSKILLPKLTGRARAIVNKLPLAQLDSYEAIKTALLSEFKLTPRELRSRFAQASKRCDES